MVTTSRGVATSVGEFAPIARTSELGCHVISRYFSLTAQSVDVSDEERIIPRSRGKPTGQHAGRTGRSDRATTPEKETTPKNSYTRPVNRPANVSNDKGPETEVSGPQLPDLDSNQEPIG